MDTRNFWWRSVSLFFWTFFHQSISQNNFLLSCYIENKIETIQLGLWKLFRVYRKFLNPKLSRLRQYSPEVMIFWRCVCMETKKYKRHKLINKIKKDDCIRSAAPWRMLLISNNKVQKQKILLFRIFRPINPSDPPPRYNNRTTP